MDCTGKKRFFRSLLVCIGLFAVLLSVRWARAGAFEVEVGAAVLMDMGTKHVLYAQDADRKIPPASLTKVMTMYVVLDKVKAGRLSLRTPVTIGKRAAHAGGSNMRLRPGEQVLLDNLLRGMAVASANDAAVAVAEHVAGSQEAFVRMMNRKAEQLGMTNTVFKTPHGLPAKGQFTTASDMLRMAGRYLEAHPSAKYYHNTPAVLHNGFLIHNTNKLLGHDGISGLKTGFTRASGYNIILTGTRRGKELLAVLLRAPSSEVRSEEAQRLLKYGENVQSGSAKASAKTVRKAVLAPRKRADSAARKSAVSRRTGGSTQKKLAFVSETGDTLPAGVRRALPYTAELGKAVRD